MSPPSVGPKRSGGVMADKHSPSQSDSVQLRKETVNRLCFKADQHWTLYVPKATLYAFPSFLIVVDMKKHP